MDDISRGYSLPRKGVNYSDLMPLLKECFEGIPFNGRDTFMNVPVVVNPIHLNEHSRLSNLLNNVLEKIVLNYFHDKRIHEIYQLDDELESILRMAELVPYKVGMYRPDLIFDKSGRPKICEIGCRYPINGWMLSYYMNRIFKKLTPSINDNWKSIPEQTEFISAISKDFDISKTLFYMHDLEQGTEAYQLFNELSKKGFKITNIYPDKLELIDGKLIVNDQTATQFILEMDREELKKIKPKLLKSLIESEICLNDVRTLILVHDKKILSVLYEEQIVRDYINEEDHAFLKRFLIPSYTLHSEKMRADLINSTTNWVLKKNSGGRGIGIYIKNDCTHEAWKEVITKHWRDYMVQEYVGQKTFDLERDNEVQKINIVGMLLCYNGQSFGPGIFRGAAKSIINVHSGGYILPCVFSKQ